MHISRIVAVQLIFIILSVSFALAAENFDIDLKELRPAPVARPAVKQQNLEIDLKELRAVKKKKPGSKKAKSKSVTKVVSAPGENGQSSYTMQPGDHLALVLVRNYGLSEAEARRLIPEVMRLNSISNLQHISVGQRIIIPLNLPAEQQTKKVTVETTVVPESPEPKREPVEQKKEQVPAVVKPVEVPIPNIEISFTDACGLARQISEKLGLLVVPPTLGLDGRVFTARNEKMSVTVACDPAPAEVITYKRLLSMHGEQLLVIDMKDSADRVVEKLAEGLGLSFRATGPSKQGGLNQEYLFLKRGPDRPEIRLIINPAAP